MTAKRELAQNQLANWFGFYYARLEIVATYNLLYNAAIMVQNKIGVALCLKLDSTYDDLCFVPLSPQMEAGSVLAWKKIRCSQKFAQLNDDVLFGEVWSREKRLSPRDRSLITVTALMTAGIFDSSLTFHLNKAKENGITKEEIAEVLTHLSFYSGWPKAWAAFRIAKEIWTEKGDAGADEIGKGAIFPVGEPNNVYAKYFTGQNYLRMLTTEGVHVAHVSFAPSCRNWWHIHHKGGQILLVTGGRGYYQESGEKARELRPGDTVNIKETLIKYKPG